IAWLDIAVDDLTLVNALERAGDLVERRKCLGHGQRALLFNAPVEALTRDKLHDEERNSALDAMADDAHQVGVAHLTGDFEFIVKALRQYRTIGDGLIGDLERDNVLLALPPRLEDGPHAA